MSTPPSVAMETETSGEPEEPKVVGSRESRTVFVSNLSMAVTEERLREKFSEVHVYTCMRTVHLYMYIL